jgi:hypothetical protein
MGSKLTNGLGITLVTGLAISAVVMSQVAFAQDRENRDSAAGVTALIGRNRIRPSDDRFQPAASMIVNEAEAGRLIAGNKAVVVFKQKIMADWIDRYVLILDSRGAPAGGGGMRQLTPAEALVLEELFSHDLSKARGIEINEHGIEGAVTPRDLGTMGPQLLQRAKAHGLERSQWYSKAASGR